jgi:hydrogenase nickel incorporation protein HypA/HybF
MHELSIVFHVIKQIEELAEENKLTEVESVTLQLGEVTGAIHEDLRDCWKWAVNRTEVMKDCELEIEVIPAVTYCEDCKNTYTTVQFGKTCPHCGSGNTYLVQGREMMIKEISAC